MVDLSKASLEQLIQEIERMQRDQEWTISNLRVAKRALDHRNIVAAVKRVGDVLERLAGI